MNILLDTHILLWYIRGDKKLTDDLRRLIEVSADTVHLSIVSLWEIAIKMNVGKLELNFKDLEKILKAVKIDLIEITFSDLEIYKQSPLHHRDPFDRLIIAQAKNRGYSLVSQDANFNLYDIELIQTK